MSIETFDDLQRLRDDEAPKQATLEALYRLYYSSDATRPSTMDAFTEELRANLHRVGTPPTAEEAEAVLAVLTTEIKDNYGDSPDTFAQAFLLEAGWLSAEVLSDATDMFQELWLHEESGNYYDALGNWYDSNRNPIGETATTAVGGPEIWLDEKSGLYYDAQGNWYNADRQPLSAAPQPQASPEQVVAPEQAAAPEQVIAPEPTDEREKTTIDPLGWVTESHQQQLDELRAARGDWRDWLPDELDARLPGWRTGSSAVLTDQLDRLIPLLALPADAVDDLDQVIDDLVDQALVPALQLLDPRLFAELSQEDIEEVVAGVLAEELSGTAN